MRIHYPLLVALLFLPFPSCNTSSPAPSPSPAAGSSPLVTPLKISVRDAETNELLPARIQLRASDGTYPQDRIGLSAAAFPYLEAHAIFIDGEYTLDLPPGKTFIKAAHGPQYATGAAEITLGAEPAAVELRLKPVFDIQKQGWLAGDAHIHMIHGERQRETSYAEIAETCHAQGLDWAYVNQEYIGAGTLDLPGLHAACEAVSSPDFRLFIGGEHPKSVLGHHALIGVSDPFLVPDDPPYYAAARAIHDQGGVFFPVHPVRYYPSKQTAGVWHDFPGNNLARELLFDAWLGPSFDGISVISDEPADADAHHLYFNLLNKRLFIPALADSDACFDRPFLAAHAPGFYINFLHLPSGADPDNNALPAAIRRGQTFATTGPLLLFSIDNQLPGATLKPDGKPHSVRILAHHDHHNWTLEKSRIARVELIRDGRIVETWRPDAESVSLDATITESEPCWYTARVYGADERWQVALSSPIYFAGESVPQKQSARTVKITGHIYDFFNGEDRPAKIQIRRGDELLQSFNAGPAFTTEMPLDATITATGDGADPIAHNLLLDYAPMHHFLWHLQSNDLGDPRTLDKFDALLSDVSLDFPLGHRIPGCYRAAKLAQDTPIPAAQLLSAPHTPGGTITTAVILLDKRGVSPGDTINIAAIFDDERTAPTDMDPLLIIEGLGFDPARPSGEVPLQVFDAFEAQWSKAIDLGDGYRQLKGHLKLAPWIAPGPNRAINLAIRSRLPGGADLSHIDLSLPFGATDRALMVAATWPTMPLCWIRHNYGVGPLQICNQAGRISQPHTDHRELHLVIGPYDIFPARDAQGHPRAQNAVFTDQFLDQILDDESHLAP